MDIVWHEHFFGPSRDEEDDVTGRYDAVEYADGRFAVWSAQSKEDVEICGSREEACRRAKALADSSAIC